MFTWRDTAGLFSFPFVIHITDRSRSSTIDITFNRTSISPIQMPAIGTHYIKMHIYDKYNINQAGFYKLHHFFSTVTKLKLINCSHKNCRSRRGILLQSVCRLANTFNGKVKLEIPDCICVAWFDLSDFEQKFVMKRCGNIVWWWLRRCQKLHAPNGFFPAAAVHGNIFQLKLHFALFTC